jgi:hypothetical protein
MPQLLRVAVIGPKVCGYCQEVIVALAKIGIVAEKRVFDPALHDKFLEQAKREGLTEMPLICTIDDNDKLVYAGAGRSNFIVTKLTVMEKRLQAAAVSA